jgi:hypothetical protein
MEISLIAAVKVEGMHFAMVQLFCYFDFQDTSAIKILRDLKRPHCSTT